MTKRPQDPINELIYRLHVEAAEADSEPVEIVKQRLRAQGKDVDGLVARVKRLVGARIDSPVVTVRGNRHRNCVRAGDTIEIGGKPYPLVPMPGGNALIEGIGFAEFTDSGSATRRIALTLHGVRKDVDSRLLKDLTSDDAARTPTPFYLAARSAKKSTRHTKTLEVRWRYVTPGFSFDILVDDRGRLLVSVLEG